MFSAGQGQLLLTTCPNIESLGFKRIPHKPTNGPICRFFCRCPLVQSIRPPKIKAQLVFWPASLYFKTTFGLSKEATSSRLQRGGGYSAYLLLAKWDIIWKHCSEDSWHHKKRENQRERLKNCITKENLLPWELFSNDLRCLLFWVKI